MHDDKVIVIDDTPRLSELRELIPFDLGDILRRQMVQRYARLGNKQVRELLKSNRYRAAALAGGGAREIARRARQLAKVSK